MSGGSGAGVGPVRPALERLEAEQAVLGAALVSRKAALRVLERLDGGALYHLCHQRVFDGMRSLHAREPRAPLDLFTVAEELERLGTLASSGGRAYLSQLAVDAADPPGLEHWLDAIDAACELRFLQELFEDGLAQLRPGADPHALRRQYASLLLARGARERGEPITLREAGETELERIRRGEREETLKFGIRGVDRLCGGLGGGELGFLGARPGVGKTTLAARLLLHCALTWGPAYFVSLEMNELQVVRREFARLSGYTFQQLRELRRQDGQGFSPADVAELEARLESFWPLAERVWIDTKSFQLSQLVARCHRMALTHGVRAVVVDYGQLVQDDRGRRGQSKTEEVMRVARALKNEVAMALEIPLFCIAAVNRDVEKRGSRGERDRKPALLQMSDLGWSSELEAVANQVLFLNPDPEMSGLDTEEVRHVLLACEKNRNGGKGVVPLLLDAPRFQFLERDLAERSPPPERACEWWEREDA